MPQNKFAFARYKIIDSLLGNNDFVKTALIVEHCRIKTGFSVSSRTIELDIAAMRDDEFLGYFAPIDYNPRYKAWFYSRNYTLCPNALSAHDIQTLRDICSACKSHLPQGEYVDFDRIVSRIELLSR